MPRKRNQANAIATAPRWSDLPTSSAPKPSTKRGKKVKAKLLREPRLWWRATNTATTTADTIIYAGWDVTSTITSASTATIWTPTTMATTTATTTGTYTVNTATQLHAANQARIYTEWAAMANQAAMARATWRQWTQDDQARQELMAQRDLARQAQLAQQQIQGAPAFIRRDEEIRQALLAAHEERERVAREAKARAQTLLFRVLTAEQRAELEAKGHFHMLTKSGRRYRIDRYTHGNVYLLNENGERVTRYCVQPNDVPVDDAIAAQKLTLDAEEEHFLRVANATVVNERDLIAAGRR